MQTVHDVLGQEVPEDGQGCWHGNVDDSNQDAKVSTGGAKYNSVLKRVLVSEDEAILRRDESMDRRLARVLYDIANDVQPGIELEEDQPSAHTDKMMPILDMNVWMSSAGVILY